MDNRLTTLEIALLKSITECDTLDGVDPVDHDVWAEEACYEFGKSAGGIMASLAKKGFAGVQGSGAEATVWITAEGFAALNQARG